MKGRTFVGGLAAALLALFGASAEQPGKVPRVGFLSPSKPPPAPTPGLDILRQGLRNLGWNDGRTVIETRFADDRPEHLPALAIELVRIPVDVLMSVATGGTQTARKATSVVPIVIYPVGDPMSAGFVASLARPGGNITGVALNNVDVAAKRPQILKEAVPNAARIGLVVNEANPEFSDLQIKATRTAVRRTAVDIDVIGVRDADEFDTRLTASRRGNALVIVPDPLFVTIPAAGRLARLALRRGLPATMDRAEFASARRSPRVRAEL